MSLDDGLRLAVPFPPEVEERDSAVYKSPTAVIRQEGFSTVRKRLALVVGVTATVAAVVSASAYPATKSVDRHGFGNHPVIAAVTNPTMTSGDGTHVRVRVYYVDAGCKVVGGIWIDPNGDQHDFSVGPNDWCHAGIGSLAPGDTSCTSPTGQPSQPGSYKQFMVLRDEKGNETDPFPFSVTCLAP